jgi:hypothetical protein
MKLRLNNTPIIILSLIFAGALNSSAQMYDKGTTITAFQAKDQYDQPYAFDAKATRYLLVSLDMETGKKANAALTALGKDYLPTKHAVYMANIQGMPAIGRMFAIPKMKKYAHRIILGDDAALIAHFPESKGKVTILTLSEGKVKEVSYWDPVSENVASLLK